MMIKQFVSPLIVVFATSFSVGAIAESSRADGYQAGLNAALNGELNKVVEDEYNARLASQESELKYSQNYQDGYKQGLTEFCTPANAKAWGGTAYAYRGACDKTSEKLRFYRDWLDVKLVSFRLN